MRTGIVIAAAVAGMAAVAGAAYRAVVYPSAPAVRPGKIKVAAIGDSNTFGAGVLFDSRGRNSYPAQLEQLLGPSYQVLNYGLNGRTLLSSGDHPYDDERFHDLSRDVAPDVVLIMLGTNDTKPWNWDAAAYEEQLRAFVAWHVDGPGRPRVYLLTPPAAYPNRFGIDPAIVETQIVPIVERVALASDVPVIDVRTATAGHPGLFRDGVHPNAQGYRLVAEAVAAALKAQLNA